jgi:hypothetical protein
MTQQSLIMTDRNYVEIDLRNLLPTVFPLNLWMGRCFYKSFWAVLGDLQESHSGTGWRAQATFP